MIVQDVIDRVKRQFGDESGVQVTNEDIFRWINDAQRDIVVKHNLLQNRATTTTIDGQADYVLPTDILSMHSLRLDNVRLDEVSIQEADLSGLAAVATKGKPQSYSYFADVLTLYPIPDAGYSLTIFYTRMPDSVKGLNDTLTIPVPYHNAVVQYALGQAYEMDENWQAAGFKSQQYTNDLSELRARKDVEPEEFYPSITYISHDGYDVGTW